MPKLSKRRCHSRTDNLAMKRLLDKNVRQKIGTSGSDEEIELNADLASISLSFTDQVTINDISDVFQLCKKKCNFKFISVLLYTSLRHFDITWRDGNCF